MKILQFDTKPATKHTYFFFRKDDEMKRNESESFKRFVFGYVFSDNSGPTIRPSGNRCTQTITIRVLCSRLPFVRSPILLSMPNFVLKSNNILFVSAKCETHIRHRYLQTPTSIPPPPKQQSFHVNCFLFLGSHLFRVSIPFHAVFMCRMWWYLTTLVVLIFHRA